MFVKQFTRFLLSYFCYTIFAILFLLSYFCYLILAILFWLYYFGYTIFAILFLLSYFLLSYFGYPIQTRWFSCSQRLLEYLTYSIPDEDYHRPASCAINFLSYTFIFQQVVNPLFYFLWQSEYAFIQSLAQLSVLTFPLIISKFTREWIYRIFSGSAKTDFLPQFHRAASYLHKYIYICEQ